MENLVTLISWKGQIQGERTDPSKTAAKLVLSTLLDAITSPGKVRVLPPCDCESPAPWPAALLQVGHALLSEHAHFAVLGEKADAFARQIADQTGAHPVPLHKADYIIAGHPLDWLDVWALSAVTGPVPRRGATVLLTSKFLFPIDIAAQPLPAADEYAYVTHEEGETPFVTPLYGRGARAQRALIACDGATRLLQRLSTRLAEHPVPIDVVLADESGRIAALPHGTWWLQGATLWAA